MAEVRKYMFDLDFTNGGRKPNREDGRAHNDSQPEVEEAPPPPPPPPTFSEEELNLARESAFDEGRRRGFTEGQEDGGLQIAHAVEALTKALPGLAEEQIRTNESIMKDAVRLAMAVVHKAMPAMAVKYAFDEVGQVVADLVAHLLDEPRIIVRVALPLVDPIRSRLEQVANSTGFEGRVVVQDDDRLGPGDCKVEWTDGGGERDLSRLLSEVDQVVERALASMPAS